MEQIDAEEVADLLERALRRPGGVGERLLQRRAGRVAERARELAPGTMADMITTRVEGTARGLVAYLGRTTRPSST